MGSCIEPPIDPPDAPPVSHFCTRCGCGADVLYDGLSGKAQVRLCPDCFRGEMGDLLDTSPDLLAEAMGYEIITNDD